MEREGGFLINEGQDFQIAAVLSIVAFAEKMLVFMQIIKLNLYFCIKFRL